MVAFTAQKMGYVGPPSNGVCSVGRSVGRTVGRSVGRSFYYKKTASCSLRPGLYSLAPPIPHLLCRENSHLGSHFGTIWGPFGGGLGRFNMVFLVILGLLKFVKNSPIKPVTGSVGRPDYFVPRRFHVVFLSQTDIKRTKNEPFEV